MNMKWIVINAVGLTPRTTNPSGMRVGIEMSLQTILEKGYSKELTKAEAILLYDSKILYEMSLEQIAHFQIRQPRLCIEFERFHEAVEKTLGHPVFSHEFAFAQRLKDELNQKVPRPSIEEIFNLIPKEKLIIVEIKAEETDENEHSNI